MRNIIQYMQPDVVQCDYSEWAQLEKLMEEIEEKEKLDNDFVMMDSAMKSLGEPCKSLLEAYYINKKHMVEIAEEFGYTNADNAKNQKYKCLMRLKKLFFAQYKQPE